MNTEFHIHRLGPNDLTLFKKLIALFHKVFETENPATADESHLKSLLAKPEFIVFVALHENEVVGGLTACELQMYASNHSEAYIYDIAIQPEFQRKGCGKKLLSAFSDYCQQNGIKEFFVEAHESDEHAVNFYRSSGGKPEKVVHFNFPTD
jgi:aminoglycoside 3-N-acetyltransferase I